MNFLRGLIHRVRRGEGDRAIARDMHLSRTTARKYRQQAEARGYLDPSKPLPNVEVLADAFGPAQEPPRNILSVEPSDGIVGKFLSRNLWDFTLLLTLPGAGHNGGRREDA